MIMLSRKDFSAPDWYKMQACIVGTAKYINLANKNLFDDYKESIAYDSYLEQVRLNLPSPFISDLINFENYKSPIPKHTLNDVSAIEVPLFQCIKDSTNLLKKVGPAELIEFRRLIFKVASIVADRVDDTSEKELTSLQRLIDTLYS